jgi:hypothetical protein
MPSIALYPPSIQYNMIPSVCVFLSGVFAKSAAKLAEREKTIQSYRLQGVSSTAKLDS